MEPNPSIENKREDGRVDNHKGSKLTKDEQLYLISMIAQFNSATQIVSEIKSALTSKSPPNSFIFTKTLKSG